MPISEDIWGAGKIPSRLKIEIVGFLQKSPQAYTAGEILNHLMQFRGEYWGEFLGFMGSMATLEGVLGELIKDGKVESKMIDREESSPIMYYRAK